MTGRSLPTGSRIRRPLTAALAIGVLLSVVCANAVAGVANRGLPHSLRSNPLAGMRWGVYTGPYYNSIYPNYQAAERTGG